MDQLLNIAKTILDELENFERNFVPKRLSTAGIGGGQGFITNQMQRALISEPFIGYVRVKERRNGTREWRDRIYLVCRNDTPLGLAPKTTSGLFLNYKSPLGSIASTKVGARREFRTPKGIKEIKIVEKDIFTPRKSQKWDAVQNEYFLLEQQGFIESLRKILDDSTKNKELLESGRRLLEELQRLEEEQRSTLNKRQTRKRGIIEKIELRDRAILDEIQDSFFRSPLNSRIILTGAPGTGKTTTIIKRLSLYSNPDNLSEEEISILSGEQITLLADVHNNWLMFTPNELLKNYLKESLGKELLPATDQTVKIWANERTELARDVLKILKVGNSGVYTKSGSDQSFNFEGNPLSFLQQFTTFYIDLIWRKFIDSVGTLSQNKLDSGMFSVEGNQDGFELAVTFNNFVKEVEILHKRVTGSSSTPSEDDFFILLERLQNFSPKFDELKGKLAAKIKAVIQHIIEKNPQIIDSTISIMREEMKQANPIQPNEPLRDSGEIQVDASEDASKELKLRAKRRIEQTLRRMASLYVKKTDSLSDKNKNPVSELILSSLDETQEKSFDLTLKLIGQTDIGLSSFATLLEGYKNVVHYIPKYYAEFRFQLLSKENKSLSNTDLQEHIKEKKLSDFEMDLLIFVMLKNARKAFLRDKSLLYGEVKDELLKDIKSKYKNQIIVDEATDFSVIQLGCMYHLSHPAFSSVTLSGDLMQRVTSFGLKNWNECKFLSEDFLVQTLERSYRQSPRLLNIATQLYREMVREEPPFQSAFADTGDDPEPLKFKSENRSELGRWIAERIIEIYKINDYHLPSIAVFVPDDEDIKDVYQVMRRPLEENSIDVEMCPEGRILGYGSKVRIFSVEYIKGLEFEGVFFVDVDKIQEKSPDLVDKFMYVGLSRATSFLAITYTHNFPSKISSVENSFKEGNWRGYHTETDSEMEIGDNDIDT